MTYLEKSEPKKSLGHQLVPTSDSCCRGQFKVCNVCIRTFYTQIASIKLNNKLYNSLFWKLGPVSHSEAFWDLGANFSICSPFKTSMSSFEPQWTLKSKYEHSQWAFKSLGKLFYNNLSIKLIIPCKQYFYFYVPGNVYYIMFSCI